MKITAAEMIVLEKLCQGKPNKIIGHEIGIAVSTVKVHVRHMMKKTGADNRVQLALMHLGILARISREDLIERETPIWAS